MSRIANIGDGKKENLDEDNGNRQERLVEGKFDGKSEGDNEGGS